MGTKHYNPLQISKYLPANAENCTWMYKERIRQRQKNVDTEVKTKIVQYSKFIALFRKGNTNETSD